MRHDRGQAADGRRQLARNGEKTRTNIMDAAETLILAQGFSASSVDQIIERAGITKGAFFYHFPSKTDLAQALVERCARQDLAMLETSMAAAEGETGDPLQQLLIVLGQFVALAEKWSSPHPGCLLASFCYEAGLFEERTLAIIRNTMLTWRARFAEKLQAAAADNPPRLAVDLDSLADAFTVATEGAFIVSRTLSDPQAVANQIRHLQTYLKLLFGLEQAEIRPAA